MKRIEFKEPEEENVESILKPAPKEDEAKRDENEGAELEQPEYEEINHQDPA